MSWSRATDAGTGPGSCRDRHRLRAGGAAERGRAVAVPADRRLRLPLELPHGRAGRRRRRDRLALRAGVRLAERLRQPARPRGGVLPASGRTGSTTRPTGPTSRGRTCSSRPGRRRSGWIVVRDALTMGPRGRADEVTPHTRPPADDDGDHMLVRTVECIEGSVEIELVCEPAFDYGRAGRRVDAGRRRAGTPPTATGAGQTDPPRLRSRARHRGQPRPRAARARGRRAGVLRALLGRGARRARRQRGGRGADGSHDAVLARLARPGADPRPSLARSDPALGAHDQGPDVHADRRDGRRAHDLAAGDAGRRAQLGLPLHLDARHDLHAAGAPLAQPRLGGRRVHAVRRRPRADTRTGRCRSCTGSTVGGT